MKKSLLLVSAILLIPHIVKADYDSYAVSIATSGDFIKVCKCDVSEFDSNPYYKVTRVDDLNVPMDHIEYFKITNGSITYKTQTVVDNIKKSATTTIDAQRMRNLSAERQDLEYNISCTTKTVLLAVYESRLAVVIAEYNSIEAKY